MDKGSEDARPINMGHPNVARNGWPQPEEKTMSKGGRGRLIILLLLLLVIVVTVCTEPGVSKWVWHSWR